MLRHSTHVVSIATTIAWLAGNSVAVQAQSLPTPYVGENFLVTMPDGYKVNYTAENNAESIHNEANTGTTWAKLIVTYVVEKGQPLVTPVK